MSVVANPRIRIRFGKQGKVRFTSHRDVARIWERALRRVALPVAYSQGFSPRPKISYGLALPTGYESVGEYLDVELDREQAEAQGLVRVSELAAADAPGGDLGERLNGVLPDGIRVQAIAPVLPGGSSLQQAVIACTWAIEVDSADLEAVAAWVEAVLDADEIIVERERKGKHVVDDIRPLVYALDLDGAGEHGVRLVALLGTQPRALRPAELLDAAFDGGVHPPLSALTVCRMQQWMSQETQETHASQQLVEPLGFRELQGTQGPAGSLELTKITQDDLRVEPLSVDAGPAALVETRA